MDIENRIKELRLIPLFPNKNFDYTSFVLEDGEEVIKISDIREEAKLSFAISLYYAKDSTINYVILGSVRNYPNGDVYLAIEEEYTHLGLADAINKFNSQYEELAKKFNELLLETLKEELEKEKEKAKEEEEKAKEEGQDGEGQDGEGQDGEGQDGEGQDGEGQDGEGQDGEGQDGEGQDGEGQDGEGQDGEGQDGEGKSSSKDIQDLINQIEKELSGESSEGQSDNGKGEIDLEDFMEKVNEGKTDNDFTKNYKNEDLKREIDEEKRDINPSPIFDDNYMDAFEEKELNSVSEVLKNNFKIDDFELKRRFPTPDFVTDFINTLSIKELESLSDKVGVQKELSLTDKRKKISVNLITEIQNI
jgi:hypothetical protein